VLIPPHPGITSAMGLLTTDLKYDSVRTEFMVDSSVDLTKLDRDFADLEAAVRSQLGADGIAEGRIRVERAADCRYVGQGYELRVPVPTGALDEDGLAAVWVAFHARHAAEYGHSFPGSPIELVSIRMVGVGTMPKIGPSGLSDDGTPGGAMLGGRGAYFRVDDALQSFPTTYYERARLCAGEVLAGPAVIFQVDSTTVLPPAWSARVDLSGSLLLTRT